MYSKYKDSVSQQVPLIVSTEWLDKKIKENDGNVRLLDASWHLPMWKRDAKQEFKDAHIPSAQLFDQNECYDSTSSYDLMAPKAEQFAEYAGRLGINSTTHVILYDNNPNLGLFSAQRAWWLFRLFGHNKLSILDGGYPKWVNDGFETTDEVNKITEQPFIVKFNSNIISSFDQVITNMESSEFQLLDARPPPRFQGTGPEPVPGVKPGHIPGSINLPFPKMLDGEKKVLKQPDELKAVFAEHGVDLTKPIIASCGSGVSGCMLVLAAYLCGKEDAILYDGSWTEFYLRANPEQMECVPEDDPQS